MNNLTRVSTPPSISPSPVSPPPSSPQVHPASAGLRSQMDLFTAVRYQPHKDHPAMYALDDTRMDEESQVRHTDARMLGTGLGTDQE